MGHWFFFPWETWNQRLFATTKIGGFEPGCSWVFREPCGRVLEILKENLWNLWVSCEQIVKYVKTSREGLGFFHKCDGIWCMTVFHFLKGRRFRFQFGLRVIDLEWLIHQKKINADCIKNTWQNMEFFNVYVCNRKGRPQWKLGRKREVEREEEKSKGLENLMGSESEKINPKSS